MPFQRSSEVLSQLAMNGFGDYCQIFNEEELEQQVTEHNRERVMKCISQVILRDPNGSIDIVVVRMYEDGLITKQTEGS